MPRRRAAPERGRRAGQELSTQAAAWRRPFVNSSAPRPHRRGWQTVARLVAARPPLARRLTSTRQQCRLIRRRIKPRIACQMEVGGLARISPTLCQRGYPTYSFQLPTVLPVTRNAPLRPPVTSCSDLEVPGARAGGQGGRQQCSCCLDASVNSLRKLQRGVDFFSDSPVRSWSDDVQAGAAAPPVRCARVCSGGSSQRRARCGESHTDSAIRRSATRSSARRRAPDRPDGH